MSAETSTWLNQNVLIGDVATRGHAWHYNEAEQGDESNHYDGAIPVEDIRRRLFDWTPLEADVKVSAVFTAEDGLQTFEFTDPDRKAIVHSKTHDVLGVFKKGYKVHGYDQWLLRNVADLLDGDLHVGAAGLLKKGAVAWAQMFVQDVIEVAGDQVRPFLTAATSLDGSMATTYKLGATRAVCDNTLSYELASGGPAVKIRHSVNSIGRLSDVRDALGMIHKATEEFTASIQALVDQKVSWQKFDKWVDAYAGIKPDMTDRARTFADERKAGLIQLWKDDERVTPWKGTAWGVVQTANTFEQHIAWAPDATTRALRNTAHMLGKETGQADRRALDLLAAV